MQVSAVFGSELGANVCEHPEVRKPASLHFQFDLVSTFSGVAEERWFAQRVCPNAHALLLGAFMDVC